MIHSLESTNFLKIDPENSIYFQFAGQSKTVCIQYQYTKNIKVNGSVQKQTMYDTIYKIKIDDITLRELLLVESLYLC